MNTRAVFRAVLAWVGGLACLWLFLPLHPRLRLTTKDEQMLVGITADSKTLVTADASTTGPTSIQVSVRRWDLNTGEQEAFPLDAMSRFSDCRESDYSIHTMMLAPGDQAVAYDYYSAHQTEASVRLFSFSAGREVLYLKDCSLGYDDESRFSSEGSYFVIWKESDCKLLSPLRLFASSSGQEIILDDPDALPYEWPRIGCFSPDSRLLALTGRLPGEKEQIQVWDIRARRLRATFQAFGRAMAISPDSRTLAAWDGSSVQLYDLTTGQNGERLEGHGGYADTLEFSGDGRRLTAYSHNGRPLERMSTWDVPTGTLQRYFQSPPPEVRWLGLNSIPSFEIPVWLPLNPNEGPPNGPWPGPYDAVQTSPNCRFAVSTDWHEDSVGRLCEKARNWWPDFRGPDASRTDLKLWEAKKCIARFAGYDDHCLFSPDGRSLVTLQQPDGTVIDVWDLPPAKPIGRILVWSLAFPLIATFPYLWCAPWRRLRL